MTSNKVARASSPIVLLLVSAVVAAVTAAVVSRFQGHSEHDATETQALVGGPSAPPAEPDWQRLLDRVSALEGQVSAAERGPRAVIPPRGDEDALARLEARLHALDELIRRAGAGPSDAAGTLSREALLAAIGKLDRNSVDGAQERARDQAALIREYLRLFPDSPEAGEMLEQLAGGLLQSGQAGEALRAFEELQAAVTLPAWRRDNLRATLLAQNGRVDDARDALEAVVADTQAPEHVRARARFDIGYNYKQSGRLDEARKAFQELAAQYADTPPAAVVDTVMGAEKQLKELSAK